MNGVDPKWVFFLGIAVTIEQGIGQGTVKLTNVVPADWAPYIVAWCTLLAFIGNIIMTALAGFSSSAKGVLMPGGAPVPPAVKNVIILALALGGLLAFGGSEAKAQAKLGPIGQKIIEAGAGNTAKDAAAGANTGIPKDLLGALDDKLLPDLQYAYAIAIATKSNVTAPCYKAWIDIIVARQQAVKDAQGNVMTLPEAHVITDFEKGIELRNALQPDSQFSISCSPVAQMVKQDILTLISKVVAGGAGLAFLGVPIIP